MRNKGFLSWLRLSAVCLTLSGLVLAIPCKALGPPPVIVTQPASETVAISGLATFSVSADSQTLLTYQWLKNGANIGLAIFSTYAIFNVHAGDAGTYSVKISNGGGTVTSSGAILTVGSPPTLQQQPNNQTVTQGQNATFSVAASGTAPLSYQWDFDGAAVVGATNSSLALTNVQGTQAGSYTAVVTNVAGSVTSRAATLTVDIAPTITTQPQSQSVTQGQNVSFSVVAEGTANLNYQWYINGSIVNGHNGRNSTYNVNGAGTGDSADYTVVVQNNWGSVTSTVATLAVGVPPGIQTQPNNLTVVEGETATFSVVANGTEPFGYQWYFNGSAGASDTNSSLSLVNAQTPQGGSYTVVVTNSWGSVTSAVAVLSVSVPPTITSQPQNQGAIQGPGQSVSFNVEAGGTAPLTYQWYLNSAPVGGPAAQGSTLTINNPGPPQAGSYTVVVSNPGSAVTSAVATLTIYIPPTITPPPPANQTVTQGQNATFSVAANGTSPLSYQWNFDGAPLSGATNSSLTLTDVQASQAGTYTAVVTNLAGTISSPPVTLTVNIPPTITTQPNSEAVASDKNASFSVVASGTAPLAYQWFFNGSPLGGPGNNTPTLTLNNVNSPNAGSYAVVVSEPGISVTSAVATLTVFIAPTIPPPPPANQTVTQGQNAAFSVAANGTSPLSYQWNFDGAAMDGATNSSLTLTDVQASQAGTYTVVVTNLAGTITSPPATLTVNVPAGITTQPQSQAVVQGQNVLFSVTPSGTPPFGYQWTFNGSAEDGATNASLGLTNLQGSQAGSYTVIVANPWGSVTSTVATLTVNIPAGIATQPQSQSVATGQIANFNVTPSGTGPFVYQWNLNAAPLPGATNQALTLNTVYATNAGGYTVVVSNSWGSATSAVVTLTIFNPTITLSVPPGAGMTPNGFILQIAAPVGVTYLILASSDLQVWTPIATNVAATGTVVFTDPAVANYPNRYYRAAAQ